MCTEKYISPFTDFGFKLLFGTPANKEFLINFLNALLVGEEVITDISYNNTEVFGKTPDDRRAVYDLYCTTDKGTHVIVEMQNAYQRYFLDRTIFYSSFPMQALSNKGDWDYRLPPIYTIAFLNFELSDNFDDPDFKHVVKLMDVASKRVFYDKLTYIYLEMPKFNKNVDELHGYLDSWMYIIKNMVYLEEKPPRFRERVFERFFREAEIARFTPEQRVAYETSLKNMRDYNNTINSAEWKGEVKGFAKGLAEGEARGRAQERVELARKLLASGFSREQIARDFGISVGELSEEDR